MKRLLLLLATVAYCQTPPGPLGNYTVATRPTVGVGTQIYVTDGLTASDCNTGGGTFAVLCIWSVDGHWLRSVVADSSGNVTIGTTMPGGAPASSVAMLGNLYAAGSTTALNSSAGIIGLWTGTCNSGSLLGADGQCKVVSAAFSAVTSGTNTTAAMLVGTGASLDVTGTGTINATSLGGTAAASYVKGAGSLTTANAVSFVASSGVLTNDANFTYASNALVMANNGASAKNLLDMGNSNASGSAYAQLHGNSNYLVFQQYGNSVAGTLYGVAVSNAGKIAADGILFLYGSTSTYIGGSGTAVAAQYDANATTDNTRMLLYDVTAGALVRVSRGASDSGGSGFRLLRIPN